MALKILITDLSHPLGQAIEHDLEREHCKLLPMLPNPLEFGAVKAHLRDHKPDLVINTFGWRDENIDLSAPEMVQAAAHLLAVTEAMGIPNIHFSSYLIFGSDSKSAHSEKDAPIPLSPLGKSFHQLEQLIEADREKSLVLRLGWVISAASNNLFGRLLNAIMTGEPTTLSCRLRGAPTLMSDVARVVVALAKQIHFGADNWGVFHYCSGDAVTEAEFGEELVQLLIQQKLLKQDVNVTIQDEVSSRLPLSAVLGCRRIRDAFGVQARSWRPGLLPLVKQWSHDHSLPKKAVDKTASNTEN